MRYPGEHTSAETSESIVFLVSATGLLSVTAFSSRFPKTAHVLAEQSRWKGPQPRPPNRYHRCGVTVNRHGQNTSNSTSSFLKHFILIRLLKPVSKDLISHALVFSHTLAVKTVSPPLFVLAPLIGAWGGAGGQGPPESERPA